jgi:hypothetical protein
MVLTPRVLETVAPIPVVTAGGIADGRGLAAAYLVGVPQPAERNIVSELLFHRTERLPQHSGAQYAGTSLWCSFPEPRVVPDRTASISRFADYWVILLKTPAVLFKNPALLSPLFFEIDIHTLR